MEFFLGNELARSDRNGGAGDLILLITVSLGLFKCFGIREPWVLGYVQDLKEPVVLQAVVFFGGGRELQMNPNNHPDNR